MRRKLLYPSIASFLLAGVAPVVAEAASSDDAQINALRSEMLQMRREMMTLKHQLAASETNQKHLNTRVNEVAGRHGQHASRIASSSYESGVQFGEQAPRKNVAALSGVGTPPSDRGEAMSWKDFRAASAQDEEVQIGGMRVGFPKGRFTIASEDGAYAFSVGLAFHEDFGGFMGVSPRAGEHKGDFSGLTENSRRMRIPFTFRYKDWVANVTPDFGAGGADGATTDQTLYEANLNYAGLHNTILTVGYFQPRVTEEDSESSNDFEMMERPVITNIVRNIAAGDARFSVGGLHYDKRWWIAGYFTGQSFGARSSTTSTYPYGITDSQTGATFRVAGRPYVSKDIDVHVGISAISAFKVAKNASGRTTSFADTPEVNLTQTKLLGSGTIPNVGSVWAAGPELGFRWKRLVLKGEYYHIGVTRGNDAANAAQRQTANFEGYYGAANYTLFGKPRAYNIKEAAFGAPGVEHEFDPAHGQWGALEISGRYSVANLNDTAAGVHGNQQTVWSGGLNWYPNRHFRFMLDFNHFIVSGNGQANGLDGYGRTGNSLAARVQAAF